MLFPIESIVEGALANLYWVLPDVGELPNILRFGRSALPVNSSKFHNPHFPDPITNVQVLSIFSDHHHWLLN